MGKNELVKKTEGFVSNMLRGGLVGHYYPAEFQIKRAKKRNESAVRYTTTAIIANAAINMWILLQGVDFWPDPDTNFQISKQIGSIGTFTYGFTSIVDAVVRTGYVLIKKKPIAHLPIEGGFSAWGQMKKVGEFYYSKWGY